MWLARLSACALAAVLAGCGAAAGPQARQPSEAMGPVTGGPVRFIQETRPSFGGKRALAAGVLSIDAQGCLRLNATGPVLIWPAEAALDLTERGVVRIFDRRSGGSVRVGQQVSLGGGSLGDVLPPLNQPLGSCAGPAWDVDSFG